jgi:hypothetical protein
VKRKSILSLALLCLCAAPAWAWDLGASYGLESVKFGLLQRQSSGKLNSPEYALNMGVIHYDLIDYSGALAAAITNTNRMLAADAGAKMDAEADAQRQLDHGAVIATGHGSRTWELAQPVEGRTLLSVGIGTTTDGTFNDGVNSGNITKANAFELDYIRNAVSEELESLPHTTWGLDIGISFKSYDVTYVPGPVSLTSSVTDNRFVMGMPLQLSLAHGLGVENLQAELYGDGDILAGIGYLCKLSGLAYGYGARIGYRAFDFVNLSAGYDMRAYTKSSVDKNDDGSLRIEGPQSIGTIRVGATLDLDYILEHYFTKVE